MVRRLVEDDQVVRGAHEPRDHHAPALAAREVADALLLLAPGEEERARQVARLLLARPQPALVGGDHALQVLPHREHRVDVLLRLAEVAHLDLRAHLHLARVRGEVAQERPHQRGLAGAVGADDPDPVHRLDGKLQAAEERPVAVRLRDALAPQHVVADARGLRQLQAHHLELGLVLDQLVLLEALQARGAAARLLRALARLVPHDVLLLGADLVQLLLVVSLAGEHALAAQADEVGVVAGVLADASLVDLDDAVHHVVEQPAVVAHEHHGPRVLLAEEVLEPAPALDVEVVGRLVEEQEVRLLEEEPRQPHARALAAGHLADQDPELVVREAEAMERLVDPVVDRVAAGALHLLLDLRLALHQRVDVGVGLRHLLVQRLHLAVELVEALEGAARGVAQRVGGLEPRVLRQVAHARAARERDGAEVGLPHARDQLHERALAAAVSPDEPHLLAGLDGDGGAVEHDVGAEAVADVRDGGDGHARGVGGYARRRWPPRGHGRCVGPRAPPCAR